MMLERLVALALLAFALGYLALAFTIRVPPTSDESPLTARSFPIVLGGVAAGIALLLALRPTRGEGANGASTLAWGRALGLIALMGGYALAIQPLGFVVTSAVFLAAGFAVLGERRLQVLVPVAVLTAFGFWITFRLLDVSLDWGVFGRMLS